DFRDDIYFGETWTADLNSFSDIVAGDGQMQPLGGLVANGQKMTAYKDAAWLFEQLAANPTASNSISINHTIWGLFAPTPFNANSDVLSWFAAATAATSGLSDQDAANLFNNVGFYTPIDGSQQPAGY